MRLTNLMSSWREAASVMLVAAGNGGKTAAQKSLRDFRVLTLERTSKSKFMPSAFVFPGGAISPVDYCEDWLKLYANCGVSNVNDSLAKPKQDLSSRAPMFTVAREWPICSDVAFRICSIRETFEEAGILLCKHMEDLRSKHNTNDAWKATNKTKLHDWRPAVRNDDRQFLTMCKDLNIVPDIWSLYEWSCWLTPTNMDKMHHGRRFDTAFYISVLPKHIDSVIDQEEIVHSKWVDPAELLQDFTRGQLYLAPPQIYDLRRLCNFKDHEVLQKFVVDRAAYGTERWLPVRVTFKDGIVPVLPGDDLYPAASDLDIEGVNSSAEYDQTMEEGRKQCKNIHRFEIASAKDCKLYKNTTKYSIHVDPLSLDEIFKATDS